MGLGRLELPTSALSGLRSNQLSYRPKELGLTNLAMTSKSSRITTPVGRKPVGRKPVGRKPVGSRKPAGRKPVDVGQLAALLEEISKTEPVGKGRPKIST